MIYIDRIERKHVLFPSENGFELLNTNQFWPDVFSQYYLNGGTSPDDNRDDMLFYIRKNPELKNRHGLIQVSFFGVFKLCVVF